VVCADDWGGPGDHDSCGAGGRAERARVARAFVDGVLGPGHPCGDVATLLVDELFVNSILHSGSAARGETVTVAVRTGSTIGCGPRIVVTAGAVAGLSPAALAAAFQLGGARRAGF
jgi:hypothetical protein